MKSAIPGVRAGAAVGGQDNFYIKFAPVYADSDNVKARLVADGQRQSELCCANEAISLAVAGCACLFSSILLQ